MSITAVGPSGAPRATAVEDRIELVEPSGRTLSLSLQKSDLAEDQRIGALLFMEDGTLVAGCATRARRRVCSTRRPEIFAPVRPMRSHLGDQTLAQQRARNSARGRGLPYFAAPTTTSRSSARGHSPASCAAASTSSRARTCRASPTPTRARGTRRRRAAAERAAALRRARRRVALPRRRRIGHQSGGQPRRAGCCARRRRRLRRLLVRLELASPAGGGGAAGGTGGGRGAGGRGRRAEGVDAARRTARRRPPRRRPPPPPDERLAVRRRRRAGRRRPPRRAAVARRAPPLRRPRPRAAELAKLGPRAAASLPSIASAPAASWRCGRPTARPAPPRRARPARRPPRRTPWSGCSRARVGGGAALLTASWPPRCYVLNDAAQDTVVALREVVAAEGGVQLVPSDGELVEAKADAGGSSDGDPCERALRLLEAGRGRRRRSVLLSARGDRPSRRARRAAELDLARGGSPPSSRRATSSRSSPGRPTCSRGCAPRRPPTPPRCRPRSTPSPASVGSPSRASTERSGVSSLRRRTRRWRARGVALRPELLGMFQRPPQS